MPINSTPHVLKAQKVKKKMTWAKPTQVISSDINYQLNWDMPWIIRHCVHKCSHNVPNWNKIISHPQSVEVPRKGTGSGNILVV